MIEHLKKYAAFFKVELIDYQLHLHGLGLKGEDWLGLVNGLDLTNDKPYILNNDYLVFQISEECYELWLNPLSQVMTTYLTGLNNSLPAKHTTGTMKPLPWLVWISEQNTQQYVAQQLNLDLIEAISFNKAVILGKR